MKIGIYSPFASVFGGSEKENSVMAQVLSRTHDVDLIVTSPVKKSELEKRFHLNMENVNIRRVSRDKIEWATHSGIRLRVNVLRNLVRDCTFRRFTRNYDVFISNAFPISFKAKKNIIRIDFPFELDRSMLYSQYGRLNMMIYDWLKSRIAPLLLDDYDLILANSKYTQKWIALYWGRNVEVLYPPVEMVEPREKKKMVLCVARFQDFKKHMPLIKTFKRLHDSVLHAWDFHIAGSIYPGLNGKRYFETVSKESEGYPIYLHPDISFSRLADLYGHAAIFWHATGFEENREEHPELFERFGITTPEAMSAGCVPVTFNGGGQPEIVDHGVNGFLWETLGELEEYTVMLSENEDMRRSMGREAINKSKQFDRRIFEESVVNIIERLQ